MDDRKELPNVRLMRVRDVSETREQRLVRTWIEAWQAKRRAEETMAGLRPEIESLLDDGVLLEAPLGTLGWSESRMLRADRVALAQDVGTYVFAKASTIPSGKIRELIHGGLVAPDAPYLSYETVRRLVTTLR
ncbi:MAG: hypothetical protein JST30_02680 [Armatimonadetes bacterium]|nr:hypothetical protein [Armatimonadota bacterium]